MRLRNHKSDYPKILMIGPGTDDLGGISRVVQIWKQGGLFKRHNIIYFPTTAPGSQNKTSVFIKSFFSYLFQLGANNTVVYIHTSSFKSFYRKSVFILPAILSRQKIILHIHPSHFFDFVNELQGLQKRFVRFLLSKISGFIVLTKDMMHKMGRLFPNQPILILRNPVDIQALRNKTGYHREKNRLLFLGWFIQEKGVFELVDAVELLINRGYKVNLFFFGRKGISQLSNYVLKKKLSHVVHVSGWIDGEQKLKQFYKSTMLVLPSHSEGIPNVILEAMATQTPIVSTKVGGLKEILVDRKNAVIVQKKNPNDLADKIALCLEDCKLRKKIAQNAFKDAKNKFDISVIKDQFKEIIDEISLKQ